MTQSLGSIRNPKSGSVNQTLIINQCKNGSVIQKLEWVSYRKSASVSKCIFSNLSFHRMVLVHVVLMIMYRCLLTFCLTLWQVSHWIQSWLLPVRVHLNIHEHNLITFATLGSFLKLTRMSYCAIGTLVLKNDVHNDIGQ